MGKIPEIAKGLVLNEVDQLAVAKVFGACGTDAGLKVGATVDKYAREHGLIARFIGDRIAFSPPLIITEAEIEEVMTRLRSALDLAWKELRG